MTIPCSVRGVKKVPRKQRSAASLLQKVCSAASHVCPACPAGISKQGHDVSILAPVYGSLHWPKIAQYPHHYVTTYQQSPACSSVPLPEVELISE